MTTTTNWTITSLADYASALSWGPTWAEAIAHAVEHDYLLGRYADPIDNGAEDIDADEAEEVAAEDPSLIYVYLPASN